MKTLSAVGLQKQAQRLADSLSHANFLLDGTTTQVEICNTIISGDTIKIYVFFDESIVGQIGQVELVDKDGDIIATSEQEFIKPDDIGFYVAFKYKFIETEVVSVEKV